MKLERAGAAALLLASALFVSSVLFRDVFIEVGLLLVLMVVAAEAAWVGVATLNPSSKFVFGEVGGPGERTVLYPGDESKKKVSLTKKVGGKAKLSSRVNFLEFVPRAFTGTGTMPVELRFSTEFAGEYSGDDADVTVSGPLGLFSSEASVPLRQSFVVYPHVLQVARATVRLLGRGEIGETPMEMPGIGSEYYEMRGYQPGDDYRNVNWKASAREGEVMVVERMREVGSSVLLVMDARAPGFRETDALASTFLSIANSLGAAGVCFGVLVHDGERVVDSSPQQDPRASLAIALKAAVRVTRLDASPEVLELVPVGVGSRYAGAAGLGSGSTIQQLSAVRRAELRASLETLDPWSTTSRYIRDTQTRGVIYVSGVFGGAQPLIELAWEARHYRDCEFMVANPCDRKQDGPDRRYLRIARAFTTAGVGYYRGEPVDVARRVLAA